MDCILLWWGSDDGDILLASCAQDCFIRVWRISASRLKAAQDTEIQLKKNTFTVFHQGKISVIRPDD